MEPLQSAQNVGRGVFVVAVARRPVMGLRDRDVPQPGQESLNADPRLGPGQRPAGTGVWPAPEGQVLLRVGAVDLELRRVLEAAGIATGGAVEDHHRGAGGDVDASHRGGPPGEPEVALDRPLHPEALLDEVLDERAVPPQPGLQVRVLADHLEGRRQQPHRRLLARREQVGGDPHHVDHLGHGAVGEGRRGQRREHVLARRAPALLDVGREAVVEELEGRVAEGALPRAAEPLRRPVPALQLLAERLVVGLGHAEEVGDDVQRERPGEVLDELALAPRDELVDLAVGVAPHEVLVLLEALRGDQAHQHAAMVLVLRRVHRGDLVAEGQLVAVGLDEVADVVALEGHWEPGERPGHRVARREGGRVGVHRDRLGVARDHHDAVVGLAQDGALCSEMVEVRIRVDDELVPAEKVDVVVIAHGCSCRVATPRGQRA